MEKDGRMQEMCRARSAHGASHCMQYHKETGGRSSTSAADLTAPACKPGSRTQPQQRLAEAHRGRTTKNAAVDRRMLCCQGCLRRALLHRWLPVMQPPSLQCSVTCRLLLWSTACTRRAGRAAEWQVPFPHHISTRLEGSLLLYSHVVFFSFTCSMYAAAPAGDRTVSPPTQNSLPHSAVRFDCEQ